jgi:hypothetical protein
MKIKMLALLSLSVIVMASCGQDVAQAIDFGAYNTGTFANNMFNDTTIKEELGPSNIDSTHEYDVASNLVLTNIGDLREGDSDVPDVQDRLLPTNYDKHAYHHRLSSSMPELQYGFKSKIFDGILYCWSGFRTTTSRLQLKSGLDEGVGFIFPKQLDDFEYAIIYLKGGADTNGGGVPITSITLHLSYYVLNDNDLYTQHTFKIAISTISHFGNPDFYAFYFDEVLNDIDVIKGASAISLEYEIVSPLPAGDLDLTSIFLYEFLMPNSVWI